MLDLTAGLQALGDKLTANATLATGILLATDGEGDTGTAPLSDIGSYIVINQMSGAGVPSVDWSGGATHCLAGVLLKRDEWIVDLACVKPQVKDLGKITGLVVRV